MPGGGEICRQHREFVAAEARDRAARADQSLQARGDLDQQAVSGRMAEQIVDLLEAVEVETEEGHILGPIGACRQLKLDDLLEMQAIRQLGQDVVPREEAQTRFAPTALRDVLVRRYPASVRKEHAEDADVPIVSQMHDARRVRRHPGQWRRQHGFPGTS